MADTPINNADMTNNRFLRLATAASFASLFSYAVVFTITPASLNEIGRVYHASPSVLGLLFWLMMSGFFVAVITAGRYSDRRGKLPTLLFGCAAMMAGLVIFASARSFGVTLASIFLMGIGGGSCEGTSMALLSDLYSDSRRTSMMNWAQAVFGVGAVTAPLAIGRLIDLGISWRYGFIGGAAICLVSILLAYAALSMRVEKPLGVQESGENWRGVLSNRLILLLCIGLLLYVGAENGPGGWLAVYFKEDLKSTGALAASSPAFFWLGVCLGRVIGAWLSRYLRDITLVMWSLALSAIFVAALLLIHAPIHGVISVLLLGICMGPIWPTIVSIAGRVYPQQSGMVLGMVVASGGLGAAIFPPVIGWLAGPLGMRHALWVSFVITVANLIIFLSLRRRSALVNEG